MRLSIYLSQRLLEYLNDKRVVVWYDGERAFAQFVRSFQVPQCHVVSAIESALAARREADTIYQGMNEPGQPTANANLLIYLPRKRTTGDARTQDPFEIYAGAGAVFGESENEQLQSLAHAAIPELVEQIDNLFLTSQPTFELLEQLRLASAYPVVEQALGTQSAVEACALVLGSDEAAAKVEAVQGAQQELLRLLHDGIGFSIPPRTKAWSTIRAKLAEFVLLSELALDLPDPWPEALANAPRADPSHRDRIYAICERLRSAEDMRVAYIIQANRIENDFGLREHFRGYLRLGVRDTFAFEERQYLAALTAAVQSNDLPQAHAILDGRKTSVWRHQPERAQIWRVAERCLTQLDAAIRVEQTKTSEFRLASLVEAYTRSGGWNDLDRCQRLMEQSWTDCVDNDEASPILEIARQRYRELSLRLQKRFHRSIEEEGWPPDSILRQTQIFDRFVLPALERRVKVAYILADALRYEMGQALTEELSALGEVALQAAAAVLPTITPNGMAALLAGADGALSLRYVGDQLVPHLGDRPLKDSDARMAVLAERYGDRFTHVTLSEWLDAKEKKRAEWGTHDLIVIRAPDIDEMGEHISQRQARKHMSSLLGELKVAAGQLARAGFNLIVIVADHGHILLPEVLAGDTVRTPEGRWGLLRRRVRVGALIKEEAGSLVFKPAHVGIQTEATDYVVPAGLAVYASDAVYFHEGLSLPECIVPVIELRPKGKPEGAAKQQSIEIRYHRDRFTSQVIGLKVHYLSMLNEPLKIQLEAYDVANIKGPPVGEAADCPARDEDTHEVTLRPNAEIDVPLLIEPDFNGPAVEIRVTDPASGVIWARLKLKNGVLD